MEEIISQIETANFHLPPEVGNDIRQRSANIHHKAKLSRQNLSRDKRQVIRNLKQKDNILILPADKGNVKLVIDKEDYCNKVTAILSNHNIYKKVKRNSIFNIEKRLLFLKMQVSFHKPLKY